MNTEQLLDILLKEKIHSWFDLGLFIDRLREENDLKDRGKRESYNSFINRIGEGGIGFLTFHYMVDGVTVETEKYANVFEKTFPGTTIHYIAGDFKSKSDTLIKNTYKRCHIPELSGFDDWKLYKYFFHTLLERGSKEYNMLIEELWKETLVIVKKLGSYIEEQKIKLLYAINLCSNPGNVSGSLALVLLSEFMGIPVISNNHDFYFEGGNSHFDRKTKNIKKGGRDHFFTNAHLGEVFSIIEMLFPWESQYWLNVNINTSQSEYLIRQKGHNPARVMEIGTAVDTEVYKNNDKRKNINTLLQFEKMLARYRKQLVGYSVEDVEKNKLISKENPKPILIGNRTRPIKRFTTENIVFLQPTRIIERKRIELGFNLLQKIFENEEMKTRFRRTSNLKITLLVSGPIASGHYEYCKSIISDFKKLLDQIPLEFKDRIFLSLLLGELDKQSFRENFEQPICIPDLYNIASLILLPSKTEGRGLPIIEATACGTPILCRRYDPEQVYSEVIGEHLKEKERLKVYEFKGKKISRKMVEILIDRIFFPHKFVEDTQHNKRIVEKRYSLIALNRNIEELIFRIHFQIQPKKKENTTARNVLIDYEKLVHFKNDDFIFLIHQKNRQYLPGYGRLSFMLMLKSLIDPSYFRNEQQRVRGSVFYFAKEIIQNDPSFEEIEKEKIDTFYNSVEELFNVTDGAHKIQHDHSMAYRHRNSRKYLYQNYTFQELTGLVNLLYLRQVQSAPKVKAELSPQFFTDWNLALLQLSTSKYLAIDNRELLIKKLHSNLPVAYFPGEFFMYELEFFALQAIRSRIGIPIEKELDRELLEKSKDTIAPVYIFAQDQKLGKQLNKGEIVNYIKCGTSEELKLLFEFELVNIISTQQLCVGIHFSQLGKEPLKILRRIREEGGFLLTNRRHAALMTDIVNIDRFHIGRIRTEYSSNIMGIPLDSGYIQYVPAGMRTTLTYPSPIQTAKDFDEALKSDEYNILVGKLGEEKLREILIQDAENQGSPIRSQLIQLLNKDSVCSKVNYSFLCGIYKDGNPYNGVISKINLKSEKWNFCTVSAKDKPKTVSGFVREFENKTNKTSKIAWNGGYILNPELVGKLGIPESYIGSPLGLIISDSICQCPPLFNKAALLFDDNGKADIRLVNCRKGIRVKGASWELLFSDANYNLEQPGEKIAYYDLMYSGGFIPGNGRTIVRLSGITIKEIIKTRKGENAPLIPVGITFSFPENLTPEGLAPGDDLDLSIIGYEDIVHGMEAGPLLMENGKCVIDMEKEGWKTANSIATQAARLDYLDMRGPKIAVGINNSGELAVLTINGRIRESVGARHNDMAEILLKYGMKKGMGFDPGGSSTLYVEGEVLNISPYNKDYEYHVFSLPPQPRAVSSAVIGFLSK